MLKFIAALRRAVVDSGRRVVIDFHATSKLYPDGTLLFLSEIDRLRRAFHGRRRIECNYPRNAIVEQVLQKVGILEILGKKAKLDEAKFDDTVRHWRFATGTTADGSTAAVVVERYQGQLAAPLTEGLFVGLTEAMTNCAQHAYVAPRGDGIAPSRDLNRWWMFSQEKDNKLTVALCDLGMGIPRSLKSSKIWDEAAIAGVLETLGLRVRSDAALIRAALELGRTRTREIHRGKGLAEILDVVRSLDGGVLEIFSNSGRYRVEGLSNVQRRENYSGSIQGTLILWQVPIDASTSAGAPESIS